MLVQSEQSQVTKALLLPLPPPQREWQRSDELLSLHDHLTQTAPSAHMALPQYNHHIQEETNSSFSSES